MNLCISKRGTRIPSQVYQKKTHPVPPCPFSGKGLFQQCPDEKGTKKVKEPNLPTTDNNLKETRGNRVVAYNYSTRRCDGARTSNGRGTRRHTREACARLRKDWVKAKNRPKIPPIRPLTLCQPQFPPHGSTPQYPPSPPGAAHISQPPRVRGYTSFFKKKERRVYACIRTCATRV